jgi:hypothetical protein
LTQSSLAGDVALDGSVFLDQYQPGAEVMRFPVSGGMTEQLPGSGLSHVVARPTHPLLLPDGRTLLAVPFAGGSRLLVASASKDPQPLIQTTEETSMPAAVLANGQLAFVLGSGAHQEIAIASLDDGRIVRRLPETRSAADLVRAGVGSLAASPDGQTLYYTSARTVWRVPSAGGQPVRIASGDSVTVHPDGSKLLIKLNEAEPRLVWMNVGPGEKRGDPQPIPVHLPPGGQLSIHTMTPDSVFKDGRIVAEVVTPDFFFLHAAIIEPATGRVEIVGIPFEGDIDYPAWTSDGRIMALGRAVSGAIWRFRPGAVR